jgi:hypothetical protein
LETSRFMKQAFAKRCTSKLFKNIPVISVMLRKIATRLDATRGSTWEPFNTATRRSNVESIASSQQDSHVKVNVEVTPVCHKCSYILKLQGR